MKLIIDCMGGDLAPLETVKGCIEAIKDSEGYELILVGNEAKISEILKQEDFSSKRLHIINADEVITNEDTPIKAIKSKKNSSMVKGFNILKEGKGEVFISAGNTGALMAGALLILGRIKGVDRPALVSPIPSEKGVVMLLDSGSNSVCRSINFVQFGIMGSLYSNQVFNVANPKVGLINIGAEQGKGPELIKQAYQALQKSDINFIGNIEGRDVVGGSVDVAVCDGFVGNIILKFLEGVGGFIFKELKEVLSESTLSKISALFLKKKLKKFKKKFDYTEYGGVPLLGVNGKVIKCHGSSNAKAIKNAIIVAHKFGESKIIDKFKQKFEDMEGDVVEWM